MSKLFPSHTTAQPPLANGILASIVLAKLLLHLLAINNYGYFRDELYYLASTEHLDWGYVDHPPLSIAILAVVKVTFGDSLAAIRSIPVLAGMAVVVLTGLITRELNGGRVAQGIAALAALFSPVFLGLCTFYSMNALDLFFWALAALVLLRAIREQRPALWAAFGIVLGFGLLNKISMLWLSGGLFAGLLFTQHRRVLRQRRPWVAALIAVTVFTPHVIWQIVNGWPTLEFMRNATSMKMLSDSPAGFLADQVLNMNVGSAPVWLAGLAVCFSRRFDPRGLVLGWMYLAVLALLLVAGSARASYLAPAYCGLLAMGGIAIEQFSLKPGRAWVRNTIIALVVAGGIASAPLALPLLPVETFVKYQAWLGMTPRTEERQSMGELPQHFADMFGWEELTALVAKAYDKLNPEERSHCRVFGQNYGEAGAIDVLGRRLGLPRALSGHNSYWLWESPDASWDVLIIIGGDPEDNAEFFEEIEIVGQTSSRWSMPYERGLNVSIARRPKFNLREAWPRVKMYI